MTAFRCLVISGEGRSDWRTIEAFDEQTAVSRLISDGLTPLQVHSGRLTLAEQLNQPIKLGRRLPIAEQALIFTQLATLVQSGLPVDRSIDLLRDQATRQAQRTMLHDILAEVRSGQGLAAAFERQQSFPDYAIGVMRAAEKSGKLGPALESLANRMTAVSATRRQLTTALTYPAAVLAATFMALVLVLTVVVPQFAPIFADEEDRLPTLTRVVLGLSGLVLEHGLLMLAAIIAATALLWALLRSANLDSLNRLRRLVPGMSLRDQYLAAQFMGVLGTLIGNGVSVIAALPLAQKAIGSKRWHHHIAGVEQAVREGTMLSRALGRQPFVPATAVRLIEVGERSGKLADTCLKASAIMGEAARARIDRIVSLANPVAIIFLGGIVAMLVAGVMLGIFALGDFVG